jgi:hypothetical protein
MESIRRRLRPLFDCSRHVSKFRRRVEWWAAESAGYILDTSFFRQIFQCLSISGDSIQVDVLYEFDIKISWQNVTVFPCQRNL